MSPELKLGPFGHHPPHYTTETAAPLCDGKVTLTPNAVNCVRQRIK